MGTAARLTRAFTVAALLAIAAACATSDQSASPPESSTSSPPTSQTADADPGFGRVREAQSGLLSASASWNRPDALTVEESQRIGLAIGDSPALTSKINQLLPNTSRTDMGTVSVGPNMRARLEVNPGDAEVTPSDFVNASTPDNVQLLWTWIVRPKRPTDSLVLTAHLEVPVEGGTALTTDIPLQIPVERTFSYTAGQIFTNWGTLSAIAAAAVGGTAWGFRRFKRRAPSREP